MVVLHLAFEAGAWVDYTLSSYSKKVISSRFHNVHRVDWSEFILCVLEYDCDRYVDFETHLQNKLWVSRVKTCKIILSHLPTTNIWYSFGFFK